MPITPGTALGRYEIRELLGAGGMGEVYRAVDTRLNRAVAIKVLASGSASDPDERARFEREAQAISSLNHPHICTLYDVGHQDGVDFLVMECLEGETLEQRLRHGPMGIEESLRCAIEVADALDQAHRGGVIHRDLKPGNVMLTSSGAKLLDFGLAHPWLAEWSVVPDAPGDRLTSAALTAKGMVVGTPGYLAPERLAGRDSDAGADLFAFGAVLYEMVTGRKAFPGTTQAEVMQALLSGPPPPVSQVRTDAPRSLDRIVDRCLASDPDERWQTARDLLSEVRWVAERRPGRRRTRRRRLMVAMVGAAAAVALAIGGVRVWNGQGGPIDSIAVLPMENATGNPSLEYLSDGITEGVIRELSPVPGLKVMSAASVFRFKGKTRDLRAIASTLHVKALLVGRLEQRADGIAITIEMIDPYDSRQLWGAHYTRTAAGILSLDEDISREVSDAVRRRITGAGEARRAQRFTESTVAYELYLKGRYYWNRRRPDDLMRSVEFFKQAIVADPQYALAYAGLADAYGVLGSLGYDVYPPSDVVPKAKEAALRALELDDQLAEAHAAMGFVLRYEWDREGAGREHERSVALNPNYATGRQWLASHYWTQGRFDDALSQLEAAQALDPLSPVISFNLGRHYYYTRDFTRAIDHFQQALALDSHFFLAGQLLAVSHLENGAPDRASEQLRATPAPPGPFLGILSYVRAATGDRAGAVQAVQQLQAVGARRYVPPYALATAYANLGMRDAAFEQLDRAVAEHSAYLDYMNVEPTMDAVRADPRFEAILRRINLPLLPLTKALGHAKSF
jgi:TolB-like protein/predicted Ser/Thr protein kinase/thioredoxin-like negative regulator of GroEL